MRNELGQMKVVQVRPSHVRLFYSRLSKQKYSHSTIKFLHNMILLSFEVAVDDDIIRKNPAKRTLEIMENRKRNAPPCPLISRKIC